MGRLTLVILMTIGTLAFSNSSANDRQLLFRLHGSNTVGARLAPALVKAWMEKAAFQEIKVIPVQTGENIVVAVDSAGADVAVEIQAHGSTTGFNGLMTGKADVGMSSRPIKETELKQLLKYGNLRSKQAEVVVGLDGIAIIVNSSNPISKLDKSSIRKIFSGEIHNWEMLGEQAKQIHVYARDDNSGTFDTFKHIVLGKQSVLTKNAKRFDSNSKLSDEVAADRWGIGFVGLPYVQKSKAIAVSDTSAAIKPNFLSVATEDYAISRRLFLYLPPKSENTYARSFTEFSASTEGQAIVDQVGFISQNIISYQQPPLGNAPDEYAKMVAGAQRLSLNIRFENGRYRLDTKALRDLDRLKDYMLQPENKSAEILLFGFADANEAIPLYSLGLSMQRVDSIAEVLLKNGIKVARVRGYGSEMPIADNQSENGRVKNRRVEVWLKK